MNKLYFIIALMTSLVLVSCEEKADGDWPPIKVNKEKLYFPKEGGEETISSLKIYAYICICTAM